jgi:membrane associated rhomboid family serine protease
LLAKPGRANQSLFSAFMNRYGFGSSDEHQPILWWRGYPVYAAHFLVGVLVASMLATTLLLFARLGPYLDWLGFSSAAVLRGQIWRPFTYGLVNAPSISFALDMVMIVWFGREVERAFGRRAFLLLYAAIYLVKPVLFTLLGFWLPTNFSGEVGAFALFVAFATLYPDAPLFFNILAKWAALALVGIFGLMALAARDWVTLLELLATSGLAYAGVRLQQGHFSLPRLRLVRRRPKLEVLPDLKPAAKATREVAPAAPPPIAKMAEVDALLDKIAQSGIGSLSARERAQLEAARADLLKRDGGKR